MLLAASKAASTFRAVFRARRGSWVAACEATRADRAFTSSARSAAPAVKLLIDGKFVDSKAKEFVDVHDPATQEVVCRVPLVRALVALLRIGPPYNAVSTSCYSAPARRASARGKSRGPNIVL